MVLEDRHHRILLEDLEDLEDLLDLGVLLFLQHLLYQVVRRHQLRLLHHLCRVDLEGPLVLGDLIRPVHLVDPNHRLHLVVLVDHQDHLHLDRLAYHRWPLDLEDHLDL